MGVISKLKRFFGVVFSKKSHQEPIFEPPIITPYKLKKPKKSHQEQNFKLKKLPNISRITTHNGVSYKKFREIVTQAKKEVKLEKLAKSPIKKISKKPIKKLPKITGGAVHRGPAYKRFKEAAMLAKKEAKVKQLGYEIKTGIGGWKPPVTKSVKKPTPKFNKQQTLNRIMNYQDKVDWGQKEVVRILRIGGTTERYFRKNKILKRRELSVLDKKEMLKYEKSIKDEAERFATRAKIHQIALEHAIGLSHLERWFDSDTYYEELTGYDLAHDSVENIRVLGTYKKDEKDLLPKNAKLLSREQKAQIMIDSIVERANRYADKIKAAPSVRSSLLLQAEAQIEDIKKLYLTKKRSKR